MLKLFLELIQIFNAIIFVLSFFVLSKKLGYEESKYNKVYKLVLLTIIIIVRLKVYKVLEYLILSIIVVGVICKFLYNLSFKKTIIYTVTYTCIYFVLERIIYFCIILSNIIIANLLRELIEVRIEFITAIIFNLGVGVFLYNFEKIKMFYEKYKYYIYISFTIILNVVILIFLAEATSNIDYTLDLLLDNKIYPEMNMLYTPFVMFAETTLPYAIVIINILIVSSLINTIRMTKKESQIKLMNEKLDLQHNYYLSAQESQDKVKKLYHDINNHIINMKSIQDDSQKVNKYIDDIEGEIKDFDCIYNTGNMLLDTILNEKSRLGKKYNIDFVCDINFSRCNFIEMIDITSIFSNLLDNSIEACSKINDNSVNKYIKIRGTIFRKYYVVKCENSKTNLVVEKNNKILTSKKNKFIHGIGIESIKSSLKKYDGELEINIEEDKFIAIIYIPLK